MLPRKIPSVGLMTLVSPNASSRLIFKVEFTGGLDKIPTRTDVDLRRKIYMKMLSVLMQKLGS